MSLGECYMRGCVPVCAMRVGDFAQTSAPMSISATCENAKEAKCGE